MSALQALADGWNSQDASQVAGAFAEDGVRHQFAAEAVRLEGRLAVQDMIAAIMASVPDCSLEVRGSFGEGANTAFDWIFRGTVQNDFGPIPGNGQAIELPGCSLLDVGADGLIREERVYWDGVYFLAGAGMLG